MSGTVIPVLMRAQHEGCVCSTTLSSDGVLGVTALVVCSVKFWDSTKGECMWTLTGHEETVP